MFAAAWSISEVSYVVRAAPLVSMRALDAAVAVARAVGHVLKPAGKRGTENVQQQRANIV